MKKHITYSVFFTIFLMVGCGEIFHFNLSYECNATNETILIKGGVPIDTLYFYDTINTTLTNKKYRIDKKETITKDTLFFSKDSVLKFFHPKGECFDRGLYYEDYEHDDVGEEYGLIVGPDDNHSLILFITQEGYELLKNSDYDSVAMVYDFCIIVHG
ncbi:MAG: hypothetical protein IKW77_04035 [Salinivirgaceae bacterium]|nr:hypothetical protein [Salinivirgaceae bacterium]